MINHLDWFLSTVWKMVSMVEVEPQMRTDINNMLTLSSVAVNQTRDGDQYRTRTRPDQTHMQVCRLAGNAENLFGIATDGASFMVGVKTGFDSQIQRRTSMVTRKSLHGSSSAVIS